MTEMKSNNIQIKYGNNSPAAEADKSENFIVAWIKKQAITLILLGTMLLGICLLAYPSFADYWNSFHQSRAVMSYAEQVGNMKEEEYAQLLSDALAYNKKLAERGISWSMSDEARAKYNETLNVSGGGVIGYIRIRKINVLLPIYHGTSENVLQTSIGHLEQSSFPVGGESTHSMLSGHRGLPSARLFTDLDKLKEGDTFTMTVLNETLTYEVDHVWIVEPSDLSHLQIEKGKDLCTLITCTPYGINTHRLLVRGHRVDNADGDAMVTADAIQIRPVFIAPFFAIPMLFVLLLYVIISTAWKRRNRRDLKAEYMAENGLTEPVFEIDNMDVIMEALRTFAGKYRKN